MKTIKDIVIIGSGNVATNLALNLVSKNYNVKFVFSPNLEHAKKLADQIGSSFSNQTKDIPYSDLYFIAIKDDAILPFVKAWNPESSAFVAHTSGSFQTDLLTPYLNAPASFYPLQTFTKDTPIQLKNVPILIEGNDEQFIQLEVIGDALSEKVQRIDAKKRKALHIAAVSVNNFTNYLLAKTKIYCQKNDLDFELLSPLLKQTIEKCTSSSEPLSIQTGPARRGDKLVIKEHLEILNNTPELKKIYDTFSNLILQEFQKNEL